MYQENIINRKPVHLELREGNYGYVNVLNEWNAMLADPEIADWGEPLILNLLELIDSLKDKDDTRRIFKSPEWKEIANRRGPIEAAWRCLCDNCKSINIGFGTSGFIDEYYTIDYQSKVITWKSVYDKDAVIPDPGLCYNCKTKLTNQEWISTFLAIKGYTIIRVE